MPLLTATEQQEEKQSRTVMPISKSAFTPFQKNLKVVNYCLLNKIPFVHYFDTTAFEYIAGESIQLPNLNLVIHHIIMDAIPPRVERNAIPHTVCGDVVNNRRRPTNKSRGSLLALVPVY